MALACPSAGRRALARQVTQHRASRSSSSSTSRAQPTSGHCTVSSPTQILPTPTPATSATCQRTTARYNAHTRIAMGTTHYVTAGALLRVLGTIQADGILDIEAMAILTSVASVITE